MKFSDILIVGGGPAGMSAALAAADEGVRITIMDRWDELGGQLIKQTHRFFGSEKEHAGTRGIEIVKILREDIAKNPLIEVKCNTDVLGIYSDRVIAYEEDRLYHRMTADKIIICTGAAEKMLQFENNDLPGVYGAGAVQTLMNVYGIQPGQKVLMIGAGNIGLIVTYQLLQAGVDVAAIVEAAPVIGGYKVHASKVRRLGVPIYTKTTVKTALGDKYVTGAVLADVDDKFEIIPGTEREIEVDTICLSVGLAPLGELISQAGAEIRYIPQLGGFIPKRSESMETSAPGIYVAGDVSCIEEATAAMIEGSIAGLSAAIATGMNRPEAIEKRDEYIEELRVLRSGNTGKKIRDGLAML
ncbi:FAD-dependent oxidoreductase [Anoxybacterium hadale]|uniref:FAD-dependent oxidoreductase n=1 Tax=Anoxybacterium hadale TaxID=3408580 RepID=A0ACD1A668_9FIRM|nr:FAD-dependent oxidoreductase [Clostridiales bacterium]